MFNFLKKSKLNRIPELDKMSEIFNSYYILKGRRVCKVKNVLEWAEFFEKKDRLIKQETLKNGKWVSTVFLGIDHSFGEGKPLLFETMVFSKRTKGSLGDDLDQDRYFTYAEALKGHKKMVKKHG